MIRSFLKSLSRQGALPIAAAVALTAAPVFAASTHTLTVAQLESFTADPTLSTPGVTQNSLPTAFLDGVNLNANFSAVPGPSMAGWTVSGLGMATSAGDKFELNLENQNGSVWSYELLVNGSLVDSLIDVPNTLPNSLGTIAMADTGGLTIHSVSIKMYSTTGVPVGGTDPFGDVRVTAVPVPAAALAGIPMLGLMGLRQLAKRRRA